MRSYSAVRTIANSSLLSYIYFNPIFRASRLVRKKLRRQLTVRARWTPRLKTS